MEFLRYSYDPKEQSIVSKQVFRPQGYSRAGIHMHDHHELVLVTSKSVCRIVNNGSWITARTPCVFINRAGTFHEVIEIMNGDYDSRVVFFHPQVFSGIPKEMLFEKQLFCADLTAITLSQDQLQSILPLFSMLQDRPVSQQLPLLLAVFAAMGQLMQSENPVQLTAGGNYIFDVIELLQNDQEGLSLSRLAQRFHVCQTKLKSDFKRITGMPVMTYKNHIRLEKARLLLESTTMKQAQIAYICGFFDESYFIRSFRKAYGITPAAYRKRAVKLG